MEMLASPGSSQSGETSSTSALANLPEGAEQPYESPDDVDFRGDFKPELVQLLMRLRAAQSEPGGTSQFAPLTPEQLKELLEKSAEIDITR